MGIVQWELHDAIYSEEDSYGTTNASPTWYEFWHNSMSLEGKRATLQSRRKLGNRQRPLPRLGKKSCEGSMDCELAFNAFEDWLEALLNGRFPVAAFTPLSITTTVSAVASSQSFTDSGSGFGTDITAGDWIVVAGFTAANNNGVFRVVSATTGAIVVDAGTTLTDEGPVVGAIAISQQLRLEAGSDSIDSFSEITASLQAVASGQHFLDAGNGLGNIEAGDWIVVAGQSAANNNGIFRVVTAAAGDITVEGGSTLTDEGPTASCTINQKTTRSFTIKGRYKDEEIYHDFLGVMPKNGQFSIVPDDISKVSFGLLGADFDASGSAPASVTAATEYDPFDALSGTFTEDGSSVCMTNLNLTVENNNMLADKCLGTTVAAEQLQGGFDVTGTIRFYFRANTHVTKFWAETTIAVVFTLSDPDGNSYTVGLPHCKLTELDLKKGESYIEAEEGYNLTAGEDPTTGVTMYVIKDAA